jgi:hypothetical protein
VSESERPGETNRPSVEVAAMACYAAEPRSGVRVNPRKPTKLNRRQVPPPGPSRGTGGRKTEPLRNEGGGGNRLICYVVADHMYKELTYLGLGPCSPHSTPTHLNGLASGAGVERHEHSAGIPGLLASLDFPASF